MAEVVNLRQARKRRQRAEKAAEADRNRAVFGQGKAGARLAETESRKREAYLDGHRLDGSLVDGGE